MEEWDNGQNALQLFPNFAFSSALASFMKAQAAEASCSETAPGGESAEEDEATPMDKLIQAILLYPIVVVKVSWMAERIARVRLAVSDSCP